MATCIQVFQTIEGLIPSGGTFPETIRIRGTTIACASGCTEVCVSLVRTSVPEVVTPEKTVPVGANRTWEVTFSVGAGDFAGGDFVCPHPDIKYAVRIRCCEHNPDDARLTEEVGVELVCTREEERDCCGIREQARIHILDSNGADRTDEACLPPGDYFFRVEPPDSQDSDYFYRWNVDNSPFAAGRGLFDLSDPPHPFSPQSYHLVEGSEDVTVSLTITLPDLPDCDFAEIDCSIIKTETLRVCSGDELVTPDCGSVSFDEFEIDCDPSTGNWAVTVKGKVEGPGRKTASLVRVQPSGDPNIDCNDLQVIEELDRDTVASGDLILTSSDDYTLPGGATYWFRIDVTEPCHVSVCEPLSLEACKKVQCPEVDWNPDVSADCNPDGTRNVTVSASVTSFGAPITAELKDAQGNLLDTGTTPANGSVTLSSDEFTLTPGNHQFTTVFTAGLPQGCAEDDFNTITIPDCDTEIGGEESLGCALLRILGLALLIAGLAAVIGGVCTANPIIAVAGVVAAVIGSGLLILWALFCAPEIGCQAFESLIGTINLLIMVFGVMAAVLAVMAAILSLLGIPVGWGCVGAALGDAGYLAVLNIILFWIFLQQECEWQADNPFQ